MSATFSQPQKLLKWAEGALNAADVLLKEFLSHGSHRLITEHDIKTGWQIEKVVLDDPVIPGGVVEHATNTLSHLRNAFDQMLFAACKAINKPIKDGHYPWAMSPTDLGHKFANNKTGKERIPNEFWDLIRSQEPYPAADTHEGGNSLLRAVATLANSKHTVGLEMVANSTVKLETVTVNVDKIIFTGLPMPKTPVFYKDGVELMRWVGGTGPEPGYKYAVDLKIGFDESAPAELRFVPALPVLAEFGQYAQNCLDGFKRRVAELGY